MKHVARIRRSLRRHAQVAMAAWRGFRYRTKIGAPVVREGLALFRRLLWLRRRRRTKFGVWRARLRACRRCELFDPKRGTCGNNEGVIQIADTGMLYPNGCSCICGVKASDPESECTLVGFGLPTMWPSLSISLDGLDSPAKPADEGKP